MIFANLIKYSIIIYAFTIFLAMVISFYLFLDERRKNKAFKYKLFSTVLLVYTGVLFFAGFIISAINTANKEDTVSNVVADGFTIDYYNVRLDVDAKQNVKVSENIGINFFEEGHHGIYRTIPEWLPYTNQENNTISKKAEITNIDVENDYFDFYEESSKINVKIGDANNTLPTGVHPYNLSYNYNLGPDEFVDYDEFIFHVYGNYWGTEIKNPYIEIHMPSEFDGNVRFYSDKYRKNDITDYVNFRIDDNIIYAKINENYNLESALTVDVLLPDGYFENSQTNNYGYGSLICCLGCIAIAISIFIFWLFRGRDLKVVDSSDNYDIPDNLDSASIGYIYKKDYGHKLFIATILQLAIKGFVKIDEVKESNETKTIITKVFSDKDIEKNKKDTEMEKKLTSELNDNEKIVYDGLFSDDSDSCDLSEFNSYYKVSFSLLENLANKYYDLVNDVDSYKCMFQSSIFSFICCILYLIGYFIIEDMNPSIQYIYDIALISVIFSIFFTTFMGKKTLYGENLKARIKSFKNNIKNVDVDRFKALVNNYDDYAYKLIPYAYVLDVSTSWNKKFKDLPSYNKNNYNDYYLWHDNYCNNIHSNLVSVSKSNSSSSGGCSSCGGGCSSCGGGGSW